MTGTISFQGVPGAYSDLACRVAYPDMQTLPCEVVRDGAGRGARRPRRPRHAAVREQPGRARVGRPPSAAEVRPVRHRRALPSRRALPARPARRPHRGPETRAFPRGRVGSGAPQPAPARAEAGGAGGYRRGRATRRGVGPQGGGRGRVIAGRRDLRTGDPAGQHRGRVAQHDPVLRDGAPAAHAGAGRGASGHDVRVPRPERARSASTRRWVASRPTAST